MSTKVCRICGETKPLSEFSPAGEGRHNSACKPCRNAALRAARAARGPKQAAPPPHDFVDLPGEVWRSIPGMDGYEASSLGRVRSVGRMTRRANGIIQASRGFILSAQAAGSHRQYLHVCLWQNGERHGVFVHQLIAWAFLGKQKPGYHVHHIDGCTTDNRAANLEYRQGSEHLSSHHSGGRNPSAILIESEVIEIKRLLSEGIARKKLAAHFGVSLSAIHNIARGKNWTSVNIDGRAA